MLPSLGGDWTAVLDREPGQAGLISMALVLLPGQLVSWESSA